ncbi:volume decrease after cellular swelling [Rhizoctonia solani]|uniref:Volume decrease after cellular swelling n=1 Tax=Rhizoctonia solani TaxID=456999 RepID=A0A8H7H560_9AGAM|nr:volume decrease after cellular swelling [Rhizoctonia solani]
MPAVVPLPQPGPPKFITLDEHKQLTASTPSSFGDIPPILQRKEENVQITFDPPVPDFSSEGKGTFGLAFVWPSGTGFTIEYPRITLHAVSRGESGPSVYCQLDESAEGPGAPGGDEEQVDSEMREMKIIPSNPESVEPIFEALSQCAALHPDPNDGGEDDGWVDEGDGGFDTFDGTNEEELSEVGRAALAHLESIIVFPEQTEDEEPVEEALEDADETKDKSGGTQPNTTTK